MKLLGVEIEVEDEVYKPSDDSLLIGRQLDVQPGERCLDIGTGSGLLALAMAKKGGEVVATDVSPLACRQALKNAQANQLSIDVVQSDLAHALEGRFHVVACNPPYLPTGPDETVQGPLNRAFDGGADGADVSRDVIAGLQHLLAPPSQNGRAYLLVSDKQPLPRLKALAEMTGLTWEVLEQEVHGGEGLACIRLTLGGPGSPIDLR